MTFKKIAKFRLDNNTYQMFSTSKNKVAFLRVENDLYYYPTENEFKKIITTFEISTGRKKAFYSENRKKSFRFAPFLIGKKTRKTMITSLLVFTCLTGCGNPKGAQSYYYGYEPIDIEVSEDYEETTDWNNNYTSGFYETEDFELLESSKMITLYNNRYFDELFGYSNIDQSSLIETLNSNSSIPDEYAYYINEFIITMNDYYKSLENRVFDYNLKTLDFEVRSPDDVDFVSGGAVAFYDIENNRMIISTDIDLKNNPKSRLIFRHELGHLFNHLRIQKDGYSIEYSFDDARRGTYLKEALNVIFTTDPFMYDYNSSEITDNMGYPIITNIVRVLTECSNFDIQESVSYNVYNFQNHLNNYYQDGMDASVIEELIELQWMEYSDDLIQVDDPDYEDLYEYVTKVFIAKNVDPSMSYEQIKELESQLKAKLLLGVSNEEYVYINKVEEVFNNFILENNISNTPRKNM